MIFDPKILQTYRLVYLKLRAISGSSRFFILNIVHKNQPINVSQIVEISRLDQPIVSQLLSVLKKANFVQSKANKKEKYYSVNMSELENIIMFSAKFLELEEKEKVAIENSYTQIFQTYTALKHLLNPGRMMLIEYLNKENEMTVGELSEISQTSQSIVSQNLSVLKRMKVISNKTEGRKSIYKIERIAFDRIKNLMESHFQKTN